jgi:hypothetical protein
VLHEIQTLQIWNPWLVRYCYMFIKRLIRFFLCTRLLEHISLKYVCPQPSLFRNVCFITIILCRYVQEGNARRMRLVWTVLISIKRFCIQRGTLRKILLQWRPQTICSSSKTSSSTQAWCNKLIRWGNVVDPKCRIWHNTCSFWISYVASFVRL